MGMDIDMDENQSVDSPLMKKAKIDIILGKESSKLITTPSPLRVNRQQTLNKSPSPMPGCN